MPRVDLRSLPPALLVLSLAIVPSVEAGPVVRFDFEGVITELTADDGLFGVPGTLSVGDPFTGHFSYELGPGNPDQAAADPLQGLYEATELVIDGSILTFSDILLGIVRVPPVATLPPLPPDPGADRFTVVALAPGSNYGSPIRLRLEAPFGSVFADDSLPNDLTLSSFTLERTVSGVVVVGLPPAPSIQDVGQIRALTRVSTVAEPAPAKVLVGVLLMLIAVRWVGSRRPVRRA